MGGGEHGHGEAPHSDFRAKVWSMPGGPNCRPKHWKRNTAIAMLGVFLVFIAIAMKSAELEQRPHHHVLRTGKISLKVHHLSSKEQEPTEKHKISREQENCSVESRNRSVEPRITKHHLQVLNEVKQFLRLNSHIIIRSKGVIPRIVSPSTSEDRSRRSREQVPAIKRSCLHIRN